MLPQTAKQLTDANRKAIQEGLCVPYTKEQHSAIQDCDLEDKRYWNFFFKHHRALYQTRIYQFRWF